MASTDRVEASFYRRDGDAYVCGLCPHGCRVPRGGYGRCGTRRGDGDMLVACNHGEVSALHVDPIEKKPLYHYVPGGECVSVGGLGCNMRCLHCQNHGIAQPGSRAGMTTHVPPEGLAGLCRRRGLDVLAFTYNEPTIWHEYIMDVARADPGLRLVLVTNGLTSEGPMRELCSVTEAMNIDVKGFTERFYSEVCGARLRDVLDSVAVAHDERVHIELTYLMIPGLNDSEAEVEGFCRWVADDISPGTPVHFTAFHPDHRMTDVPRTPVGTLLRCRRIGSEAGLPFVYIGNAACEGAGDTVCPGCGAVAVRRTGYRVDASGLDGPRCRGCGEDLGIVRRG